jgi:hypothetical protein
MQIRGANILGLPVITTEQYPKALGNTVQELKDVLPPESPVVAKTLFSMLTPDVKELLKQKPAVSQVGRRSWLECAAVVSRALDSSCRQDRGHEEQSQEPACTLAV